MSPVEYVARLENVSKKYGRVQAVSDLSLEIGRGEIFGLLGPNGAGKTTTLRILAGLVRQRKGRVILFGGEGASGRLRFAARSGMLIETPGLHPGLSAWSNLMLFGRIRGLGGKELGDAAGAALDFAGLGEGRYRKTSTYSAGMLRKAGIALAILGRPEFVVLDEPSSGLDPESVIHLRDGIRSMNAESGATFLVSSHNLAEMETLCGRVGIVSEGRLLAAGTPESLWRDCPSAFVIGVSASEDGLPGKIAAESGFKVLSASDGRIEVQTTHSALPSLVRRLVEGGIEVGMVKPSRSLLEETYMRLTKRMKTGCREEGEDL